MYVRVSRGPENYYGMIYVETDDETLFHRLIIPNNDGDIQVNISAYLASAWKNDFPLEESEENNDE